MSQIWFSKYLKTEIKRSNVRNCSYISFIRHACRISQAPSIKPVMMRNASTQIKFNGSSTRTNYNPLNTEIFCCIATTTSYFCWFFYLDTPRNPLSFIHPNKLLPRGLIQDPTHILMGNILAAVIHRPLIPIKIEWDFVHNRMCSPRSENSIHHNPKTSTLPTQWGFEKKNSDFGKRFCGGPRNRTRANVPLHHVAAKVQNLSGNKAMNCMTIQWGPSKC